MVVTPTPSSLAEEFMKTMEAALKKGASPQEVGFTLLISFISWSVNFSGREETAQLLRGISEDLKNETGRYPWSAKKH